LSFLFLERFGFYAAAATVDASYCVFLALATREFDLPN
jgi:hypothetical protein